MSLRQRAARAALWASIQTWGGRLLSFGVFAFLAHRIAPQSFGVVALAAVFLAFFESTLVQSFAEALVRRQNIEQQHLDVCFWLTLGFGLLAAALTFTLSAAAAQLFLEPAVGPVLNWLALGIPLTALGKVHEALLRRELRFKQLAVRSLGAVVASSCIAIALAIAGFGVWSLVVKSLVEAACGSVILWLSHPWRPTLHFSAAHFRDLRGFGVRLTLTRSLELISQRLDALMIGRTLGSVQLAQYTIGQRLSQFMMDTLHQSISSVSMPAFATIQEDRARLKAAYLKTIRFTAFAAMPAFATVGMLARDVVWLVFGPQWFPAVPVLQVFCVGGVFFCFTYFVAPLLIAKGLAGWHMLLVGLNAVQGLSFLVVARWGIVPVAAALVIRGMITSVVGMVMVKKAAGVGVAETLRAVSGPGFLTVLTALAIALVNWVAADAGSPGILRLALSGLLAIAVYLTSARYLTPHLFNEAVGTLGEVVPSSRRLLQRISP